MNDEERWESLKGLGEQVNEALKGVESNQRAEQGMDALNSELGKFAKTHMLGAASHLACILQDAGVPSVAAASTIIGMLSTHFMHTIVEGAIMAAREELREGEDG